MTGLVALVVATLTSPATATTPTPLFGLTPGVSTTAFGSLDVFYEINDGSLAHKQRGTSGWGPTENLGGVLATGPAPITIGSEFANTWVFVVGQDSRVWYRRFSDGTGLWSGWTTIGGVAFDTPATSCTGDITAQPIVYVVGSDSALWRRSLAGGGWSRLGGQLGSAPTVVPAVAGVCPPTQDIFVLGTDAAVWERVGAGWQRIGGLSFYAPAVIRLASGETDLYVRGTDDALWQKIRPPQSSAWSGWRRIGGVLRSAPVVQIWPGSPETRTVLVQGSNGQLYRGANPVGSSTWTWVQVP